MYLCATCSQHVWATRVVFNQRENIQCQVPVILVCVCTTSMPFPKVLLFLFFVLPTNFGRQQTISRPRERDILRTNSANLFELMWDAFWLETCWKASYKHQGDFGEMQDARRKCSATHHTSVILCGKHICRHCLGTRADKQWYLSWFHLAWKTIFQLLYHMQELLRFAWLVKLPCQVLQNHCRIS